MVHSVQCQTDTGNQRSEMKRTLVVGISVALVLGISSSAQAAGPDARSIIKAKTGTDAVQTTTARSVDGITVGTGRDKKGKGLANFTQPTTKGFRMMAVLTDQSQTAVDFPMSLPVGAEVKVLPDGSAVVFRERVGPQAGRGGVEQFGTIGKPWASDARGKALATSYTYAGGVLTQRVDTAGATFPVVADPTVDRGYYWTPVYYIKWTRAETVYLHGNIGWIAIAIGTLCGRTGPAAPACGFFGAMLAYDIQVNTDAAYPNPRRCFKQRIPAAPYVSLLWIYDGYTVNC